MRRIAFFVTTSAAKTRRWLSTEVVRRIVRRTMPEPTRRRLRYQLQRWQGLSEPQIIARGWERYARNWKPEQVPQVLPGGRVQYIGDEWTGQENYEDPGKQNYGLPLDVVDNFQNYINKNLLDPYLPSGGLTEGLEIGPGGGRLTALLLPRTKVLHVADTSETMLEHLKQRFAGVPSLRAYHTDATSLPALRPASLDCVFSFDVFVHFEPRMIYWYLRQIEGLLKPGGIGIIHYSNVFTDLGWSRFERNVEFNLHGRNDFGAFGVMCPPLMGKFLDALQLEVISTNVGLIPRDAIAVFRKRMNST